MSNCLGDNVTADSLIRLTPKCRTLKQSLLAGLAAGLLAFGATSALAKSSRPDAPSVSPQAQATAAKQHPQILAEFGGALEGPTAAYVNTVGQKMATAAGLPGKCTFSVVNSDVVNAFAVPGCYIYITRGLLAIMNSEDELASVLGHEVGHVTADHSGRRQKTATLTTLGAILAGVVTKSGQVMQTVGQLGQVYTLSYSRDQEFEADDLGVRYLGGAGYNRYAASDMLNALGVNDALTAKTSNRPTSASTPAWARSHPLSADRVVRSVGRAKSAGAVRETPPELSTPYLNAIRGLIYGDDPEQGFVNGRTFSHPKLKIAFEAPEGFSMTNTPAAIIINGQSGQAKFGGGKLPPEGLEAFAAQTLTSVIGKSPAQIGQRQSSKTNGLDTVIAPARAQNQNGQILDVVVCAYRVGDSAYAFVTMSPSNAAPPFAAMVQSFRQISDADAAKLRARQIELVTVGPKDTLATLSSRMAFADYQQDRFLSLNGRDASTPLKPGEVVKIVTYVK